MVSVAGGVVVQCIATVKVRKFEDVDGNGSKDTGEAYLSGWTFKLERTMDAAGHAVSGESKTGVTGADGSYTFSGLWGPGTYVLTEISGPADWTDYDCTTHSTKSVTFSLTDTQQRDQDKFGNRKREVIDNEISGHKLNDLDGDGNDDPDTGLNGWTINLFKKDGTLVASTVTADKGGEAGHWAFYDLPKGDYYVQEVPKAGWTQTRGPSEDDPANSFYLGATTKKCGLDFRNHEETLDNEISGHKFGDIDNDGLAETGEPGLNGWAVNLYKKDGTLVASTVTADKGGVAGHWAFYNVAAGEYYVQEVLKAGWTQTRGPSEVSSSHAFRLEHDGKKCDLDFWNYKPGTASVHKFNDLDGNGVQNGSETGMARSFTLTGPGGYSVTKSTGPVTGDQSWTDLNPGTYTLSETTDPAWYQSTTPALPKTFTLGLGDTFSIVVGNVNYAKVNVHKFNDLNGDGDQDNLEPNLIRSFVLTGPDGSSPPINTDDNGNLSFTNLKPGTYTLDEPTLSSWFETTNLLPVTFVLAGGETKSFVIGNRKQVTKTFDLTYGDPPAGGTFWVQYTTAGGTFQVQLDDPAPSGHFVGSVPVIASTDLLSVTWMVTWNGHDIPLGTEGLETISQDTINYFTYQNSLGGQKREDVDRDADPADADAGLDGWTISLYRVGDVPTGAGPTAAISPIADLYATTLTSGGGYYEFFDVPPGRYYVQETLQAGWDQMLEPVASDPAHTFSVVNGQDVGRLDFLNAHGQVVKTFDLTFEDAPEGADYSVGYSGTIGGETLSGSVDLIDRGDGSFTATMPVAVGTTFSQFDWHADESGWPSEILGTTGPETITADKTNSFTYEGGASGHKFNDRNGNGAWDTGEPGLSGWEITLYRLRPSTVDQLPNGVIGQPAGQWVVYDTAITGAGGDYAFDGLLPGMYYVDETLKPDWTKTKDASTPFSIVNGQPIGDLDFGNRAQVTKVFQLSYAGAPDGATFGVDYVLDGGPLQTLGLSAGGSTFTGSLPLMAVSTVSSWTWFAMYQGEKVPLGTGGPETISDDATNTFTYNGSLSGHKFNDLNGNGVWDSGEPALADWTIALYRKAPQQLTAAVLEVTPAVPAGYVLYAQTTTAADGSYSFSGVLPGSYYLAEGVKSGWIMTKSPSGPITVADGTALADLDFGNWVPFIPFTPPDTGITKTVSPTLVTPGEEVVYTLRYYNNGKGSATDIVVVDDYDETRMDVVDASGGTVAGGKITWIIAGPLAPGASGTITYRMRVKDDVAAGTVIDNTVQVYIVGIPDETMADNADSARITVTGAPFLPFTGADMTLLLVAAATLALAGLALRRFARIGA